MEALRTIVLRSRAADSEGGDGQSAGRDVAGDVLTWLMVWLAKAQREGLVAQYPDGRYGPVLKRRR